MGATVLGCPRKPEVRSRSVRIIKTFLTDIISLALPLVEITELDVPILKIGFFSKAHNFSH